MIEKDDVLALLDRARKHWDEHPPGPPSEQAAELARRVIHLRPRAGKSGDPKRRDAD